MRTDANTFKSIQSFLNWDHDRLVRELASVIRVADAGDPTAFQRAFRHFDRGMRRHLAMKERVIFQLYAFERTGEAQGPVQAMEAEHRKMTALLDGLERSIESMDLETFRRQAGELQLAVDSGAARKLCELYQLVDALLGPHEAERLVEALQA